MTAAEKLAQVMLREKQGKKRKYSGLKKYRSGVRQGIRQALMEIPEKLENRMTPAGVEALFGKTYRTATEAQQKFRKLHGYTGRGLYTGRGSFWDTLRSGWDATAGVRGMVGDAARAGTFGATGMALGQASKALGLGAYITNDLVNGGGGAADGVPSFGAPSDQGVMLSNSEYVSDVFGPETTGAFQNLTYDINPGLFKTFPWLSQVAQNYEEYELKQLIFTYKPTITDFVSTNGQVGSLIMATQYNVEDLPFTNKQDMMHYAGSMACKVSQGMLHGVECDPSKNAGSPGKFIRGGPILQTQDATNFDLGTLNVAVTSTPSEFNSKALGELWVSYTVVLRKPKFYVAEGSNIVQDYFLSVAPGQATGGSAIGPTWPIYPALQNRINGELLMIDANTVGYKFPATLSGTFKCKLKLISGTQSTQNSNSFTVSLSNLNTSMFEIKDMMHIVPYGSPGLLQQLAWDWKVQKGSNIAGIETSVIEIEADIRLETPTSAGITADNIILFSPTNPQGINNYLGVEFICVNYNNYFDYNGQGQVMLLSDATDQLVTPVTFVN